MLTPINVKIPRINLVETGPSGNGEPKMQTTASADTPTIIDDAAPANVPFLQNKGPSAAGTGYKTISSPNAATGTRNP